MLTGVPHWAAWAELVVRVLWIAEAVLVARAMGRRGHDSGLWFLAGLLLGPFAIGTAVRSTRRASRRPPMVIAPGIPGPGTLDVLVVVDDMAPAAAVGTGRVTPVGLGRLTLAVVVGRDTFDGAARAAELEHAEQALAAAAATMPAGVRPAQVILEGRPADAVRSYAESSEVTQVLVAPTEKGRRLARQLSARLTVPVRDVGLARVQSIVTSNAREVRRSA